MGELKYRKLARDYKYEVTENRSVYIRFKLPMTYRVPLCHFELGDQSIHFSKGFKWDGPSGPTIDTPDSMEASLVHDFLYSLMRDGDLPKKWRRRADLIFRRLPKRHKMPFLRRWAWWISVRFFGGEHIG